MLAYFTKVTAFDIKNNVGDWRFLFLNTISESWYSIKVIHIKPNCDSINSGDYKAWYIVKVSLPLSEFLLNRQYNLRRPTESRDNSQHSDDWNIWGNGWPLVQNKGNLCTYSHLREQTVMLSNIRKTNVYLHKQNVVKQCYNNIQKISDAGRALQIWGGPHC